jgi:hypothetical protein
MQLDAGSLVDEAGSVTSETGSGVSTALLAAVGAEHADGRTR